MVKNIFTVRHGEAVHQVDSSIWETCSNCEIPLTPLGKSQSVACGRFFANMPVKPDTTLIITSPYNRAFQTAEEIIKKTGPLKIVTDQLLVEQNFGMFTGLSTEQCYEKYPVLAKLYDLYAEEYGDYFVKAPKGENKESIVKRAEQFIENTVPWFKDSKYENLIIVSHCAINRAISKVLNNATPEWFLAQEQQPNGAIRKFSFLKGKWQDRGFVFIPQNQGSSRTIANPYKLKKKGLEK